MDYGRPALAEALGAQYVTGTLRGRARARFEALLPSHPALQAAVQSWQQRLMPLTDALREVVPPPQVWQAIEARLWPAAAHAEPARPASLWQRLALWRTLSGLALAAVVGLAVLLGQPLPPASPPVVVVLQGTGADPAGAGSIVASFAGDGRSVVARPLTPVALKPERSLQLWWARAEGGPKPLGLISPDGTTVLAAGALPGGLQGSGIDHLAVSIEPPGGSPTGQPTGPVVFVGKLTPPQPAR
ncbi:MAG: anti-sigma factor [Rubrivivax sp.]